LLAPKGTPKAVVDFLNQKITKIVGEPEVASVWAKSGVTPMKMTPAQFTDYLNGDIEKWGKIVKSANIKVD
jgi:tripartite-type tricarboxylate transporter receptor subunit TctC